MIRPMRWVTHQAATGLKDLPRNSTWLLSKALAAPSAMTRAASDGITGGMRRMTMAAADRLPERHDTVEARLKHAEAAVAGAKKAERDALAEAQHVKALAEAAKAAADDGQVRVRQALGDAEQEVERRMRAARVHFAQRLDKERDKASRETAKAVQRVTADVRSSVDKARGVAQAAAEMAQDRISSAQQQMAEARSLAAEAVEAAERIASEAREHARAIGEQAGGLGTRSPGTAPRAGSATEQFLVDEATCLVVTEGE